MEQTNNLSSVLVSKVYQIFGRVLWGIEIERGLVKVKSGLPPFYLFLSLPDEVFMCFSVVLGQILAAIGYARLLISQKLQQYSYYVSMRIELLSTLPPFCTISIHLHCSQ